jgi:hypothetical protein
VADGECPTCREYSPDDLEDVLAEMVDRLTDELMEARDEIRDRADELSRREQIIVDLRAECDELRKAVLEVVLRAEAECDRLAARVKELESKPTRPRRVEYDLWEEMQGEDI